MGAFHHAGTVTPNLPMTKSDITFTTATTINTFTNIATGSLTTLTTSFIGAPSTSKSITTQSIDFLTTSSSPHSVTTMLATTLATTTNPVTTLATESVTTKTINTVSIPIAKSDIPLATEPVAVFMTSSTANTVTTIHAKPVTKSPVTTVATSGTATTCHLATFTTSKAITTKFMRSNSSNAKNEKSTSGSKHHKLKIITTNDLLDSALNNVLDKGLEYFQVKEDQFNIENINDEDQDLVQEETTGQGDMQQTQGLLNLPLKLELTHDSTSDVDKTHDVNLMSDDFSTMKYDFSKLPWSVVISKQTSDFLKKKKTPKNVLRDIEKTLYIIGQGY